MNQDLARPSVFFRFLSVLLALLLGGLFGSAQAHSTSDHLLNLTVTGRQVQGSWDVMLTDLDYTLRLDQDGDQRVGNEEMRVSGQRAHLQVRAAGQPCPLDDTSMQIGKNENGRFLRLNLAGTCPDAPASLSVRNTLFTDTNDQSRHRGYLNLDVGGRVQTNVFSKDTPEATVRVAAPNVWASLGRFVWLGMTHIWGGLDHVLFLVTLLLPAVLRYQQGRWVPVGDFRQALASVLKVVTAFTLAHSVTLTLAALEIIHLPSRWVEATIAVSVVFTALNNLFPVVGERSRWAVAFGFGLIHGFGFSSALGELVSDRRALVESLIGFNLGVEIGQLAIVLVLVPAAFWLRSTFFYRRVVFVPASALVAVIASLWFMQRVVQ